jgi:hypothetical protein
VKSFVRSQLHRVGFRHPGWATTSRTLNDSVLFDGHEIPADAVIAYARRVVKRRHHVPDQDVDDVIATALLDFTVVRRSGRECGDGLFLVIAHRRACDFWRAHRDDLPLEAAERVWSVPQDARLAERAIEERLLQSTIRRGARERRRLLRITHDILAGASFAEACRATGVPRGSQARYRETLKSFLDSPVVRHELLGDRTRFGPRPHHRAVRVAKGTGIA